MESKCHDHWQGIRLRTITVGKPDAPFHIARLQHSAFVTARMAARSVGAITSNSLTNSISFIHTLAASDGTAILPHPSIVIVVRSIDCAL